VPALAYAPGGNPIRSGCTQTGMPDSGMVRDPVSGSKRVDDFGRSSTSNEPTRNRRTGQARQYADVGR
jgi:hypothetical protein